MHIPRANSLKQGRILPLNYQHESTSLTFQHSFLWVQTAPQTALHKLCETTPQTLRLAGSCQEVCCQSISTYEIQAGSCRQGVHALTDRKKTRCSRRRLETHWNRGGALWIHGGLYRYTVDDYHRTVPNKSIHCTNYIRYPWLNGLGFINVYNCLKNLKLPLTPWKN